MMLEAARLRLLDLFHDEIDDFVSVKPDITFMNWDWTSPVTKQVIVVTIWLPEVPVLNASAKIRAWEKLKW